MNIQNILTRATQYLIKTSDSPALDAALLLAYVLQVSQTYLHTWPEREVTTQQEEQFDILLHRRQQGEPIAYLIGYWEFWTLDLLVNHDVLIPRPETELLVETVLKKLSAEGKQCVLDLGTGSGAIALAIAKERSHWQVTALDQSKKAIQLVQQNAKRNHITNVCFIQNDWLSEFTTERFDAIVSNPPYIAKDDEHLQQKELQFEPISALVGGDDGLAAIRNIVKRAPYHLQKSGWLMLEHGYDQALQVKTLMQQAGFAMIQTEQDLAGQDRVTSGQMPNLV